MDSTTSHLPPSDSTHQPRVVLVVPAYQPDGRLLRLVESVRDGDDAVRVVVVDDGSGEKAQPVFSALRARAGVSVLRHAVNLGKGQALKTAFNDVLCGAGPSTIGVVTADADGQHLPHDIARLVHALRDAPDALSLGTRNLRGDIPWKSRIGNGLTRLVFRGVVGRKIEDTQTGLRAIPLAFLPHLLRINAAGYDFELEMLIEAVRRELRLVEIPIETVYEDGNKGTHFNPVRDSLRIYFVFIRFTLLSLTTAAIDFAAFAMAFAATTNVALSTAAARLIAGTYNFRMARSAVFHSNDRSYGPLLKYTALVVWLAVVSYGLVTVLVTVLGVGVFWAKAFAETVLFVASFGIQRALVFRRVPTTVRP